MMDIEFFFLNFTYGKAWLRLLQGGKVTRSEIALGLQLHCTALLCLRLWESIYLPCSFIKLKLASTQKCQHWLSIIMPEAKWLRWPNRQFLLAVQKKELLPLRSKGKEALLRSYINTLSFEGLRIRLKSQSDSRLSDTTKENAGRGWTHNTLRVDHNCAEVFGWVYTVLTIQLGVCNKNSA